jgi:hypothetical protein
MAPKVVQIPTVPIHPRLIERYERERAELTKLIKPEVMVKADQEMECFVLGTGCKRGLTA